jgi:hypothetical protein
MRIALLGPVNSGKSYSRVTIPDGENVLILEASYKTTYLTTSANKPVEMLSISTAKYKGWDEAKEYYKLSSHSSITPILKYLLGKYKPGQFQRKHLPGNIAICKDIKDIPDWLYFVNKFMPWIHTIILPDFTHYISEIISTPAFIERKAGGEAYQRFWELAAHALRGFILASDNIRPETLVVSEYHAEYNEAAEAYEVFTSGGKMLTEKFLPTSYYDVVLYAHTVFNEDSEEKEVVDYKFVTRRTRKYPDARAMNMFDELFIPNDLNLVLEKLRETTGLHKPIYNESSGAA